MDGGAWWATVHGVTESRTRLSDFTFTFHSYALEKEMATHSSVLALRIPGTGEPGGLPSMGLHRVGHDWSDLAACNLSQSHFPFSFIEVIFILSFFFLISVFYSYFYMFVNQQAHIEHFCIFIFHMNGNELLIVIRFWVNTAFWNSCWYLSSNFSF